MAPLRSSDELLSVRRALVTLELLACAPEGRGVSDLARELGVHKSSASRLLGTLQNGGLVDINAASGRFELGAGFLRLAARAVERLDLARLSLPFLRGLAERSGETAYLSVRRGLHRVAVQEVESVSAVRMVAGVGHPYPLYRGAPSKILLAALPDDEVERILTAIPPEDVSSRQVVDLRAQIARAQQDGYAISIEENSPSAAAVAVPIRGHLGNVVAALGVAGVTPRWDEQRMLAFLPTLRQSASEIAQLIGYASSDGVPARPGRSLGRVSGP